MGKQQLSESDYIAELNRQLKEDDYYEDGMEFVPHPEGASVSQMSGYSVRGPRTKIGVFARVAYRVSEKYDLMV